MHCEMISWKRRQWNSRF